MTCSDIHSLLSAFDDGALDLLHDIAVGEHLDACWLCAEELALLREELLEVRRQVEDLPVESDMAGLKNALLVADALERIESTEPARKYIRLTEHHLGALAAILLLSMAGMSGLANPNPKAPQPDEAGIHLRSGCTMDSYLRQINFWLDRS